MLVDQTKRRCCMVSLILLAGCAGVSPRIAENYDANNLKRRKLVVYCKDRVVAMPYSASENFKSTFEDHGVDLKAFRAKVDDLFYNELKDLAGYGRIVIDTSYNGDSSQVVGFQKDNFNFHGSVPREIKNDSVLILGLGIIDYRKRTDYSTGTPGSALQSGTHIYLDAKMDYVIYDPLIHSAIAGGRVAASSTSLLGYVITESDWYSDAKKLASHLVDDLNELR